ncbi:MAG: DUF6794 domain-containing protein [Saprospiraceae bacterium]
MKYIFALILLSSGLHAQIDFEKEYEKQYDINIQKEFINDVYIPIDFAEAFAELKRLASEEALLKFKNAKEDIIRRKLHFGIGRWISVNWNYEGGSRFSHQMKQMGVTFPDDMVEMTIVSFHRHLNDTKLQFNEQAIAFFDKRKKENEERIHNAKKVAVKNN